MVEETKKSMISGTPEASSESKGCGTAEEEERLLVRRAATGHRPSYDRLVVRYHSAVYRVAYRFFNNSEDAGDATQEVFLKAWRAIGSFEGRSSFKTWILRVAGNTCITLSQSRTRQRKSLLDSIIDWFSKKPVDDPADIVLEKEFQGELRHAIEKHLAKIPEVYRMPVILRDMEGYSHDQIAEVLEIKEGTVKSRINRGRRLLQEALEPLLRQERNR